MNESEHVERLDTVSSPPSDGIKSPSMEPAALADPNPPGSPTSNLNRFSQVESLVGDKEEAEKEEGEKPLSRAASGDQVDLSSPPSSNHEGLVETVIEWKGGGHQVFVTGNFTGWKQMIPLHHIDQGLFAVVLKLSPGTHRLRFVVDGELRCSDSMNTATDSMGNLVNYMEVVPQQSEYTKWVDEQEKPKIKYTREIPEIFVNPEALDKLSSSDFTTPPHLPPHLDGVILNANWSEKDNNSVLPVPNHVVLNHLATTSIRHNVLAVASVSRYHEKFVTQILYTPL